MFNLYNYNMTSSGLHCELIGWFWLDKIGVYLVYYCPASVGLKSLCGVFLYANKSLHSLVLMKTHWVYPRGLRKCGKSISFHIKHFFFLKSLNPALFTSICYMCTRPTHKKPCCIAQVEYSKVPLRCDQYTVTSRLDVVSKTKLFSSVTFDFLQH